MLTQGISNSEVGPERWIESDPVEFRDKFNERSFEIRHHLSSHPLFKIDELMALAKRMRKNNPTRLYYDAGEIRVDQQPALVEALKQRHAGQHFPGQRANVFLHAGIDDARAHGDGAEAIAMVFGGKRAGQHFQSGLGRAVVGHAGHWIDRGARGDVDDPAFA